MRVSVVGGMRYVWDAAVVCPLAASYLSAAQGLGGACGVEGTVQLGCECTGSAKVGAPCCLPRGDCGLA